MQMSEPGLSCIYCVPPCVLAQIYEHLLRKPGKVMEVILRQTNIPSKFNTSGYGNYVIKNSGYVGCLWRVN